MFFVNFTDIMDANIPFIFSTTEGMGPTAELEMLFQNQNPFTMQGQ